MCAIRCTWKSHVLWCVYCGAGGEGFSTCHGSRTPSHMNVTSRTTPPNAFRIRRRTATAQRAVDLHTPQPITTAGVGGRVNLAGGNFRREKFGRSCQKRRGKCGGPPQGSRYCCAVVGSQSLLYCSAGSMSHSRRMCSVVVRGIAQSVPFSPPLTEFFVESSTRNVPHTKTFHCATAGKGAVSVWGKFAEAPGFSVGNLAANSNTPFPRQVHC